MRLDRHEVEESLRSVKKIKPDTALLRKIFSLIDLTSLNESDTEREIATLCEKAIYPHGHVAAVCVYPPFVKQCVKHLKDKPIRIATVANYPLGRDTIEHTLQTIRHCIADGANEMDVVFPYARYLAGDRETARAFVQKCKEVCGKHILLKVILETSALQELPLIDEVCYDMIMSGADFIKTSTGKMGVGATIESSAVILLTLKKTFEKTGKAVGFKAAGGITTIDQAIQYVELAEYIMGPDWVHPTRFRIGASQLLDALLKKLSG